MREIEERLRGCGGVLHRRSHRDLSGSIDRMLRTGQLTALLPGVYCASVDALNPLVRCRAATLWGGPDAVLTGHTAARLSFWSTCPLERITLALPTQAKRSQPGFVVQQRRIPAELTWVRTGARLTSPALTAVDLAAGPGGGDIIDRVLRSGQASLDQMWTALAAQPHRIGNEARAALLRDSRDEPWSEAERAQHRLLRAARITGWCTNRRLWIAGRSYIVDVWFERERLALEVDGWDAHGSRDAFESDRRRRNELVLAGCRILNFTWRHLMDDPDWVVACVRTALAR